MHPYFVHVELVLFIIYLSLFQVIFGILLGFSILLLGTNQIIIHNMIIIFVHPYFVHHYFVHVQLVLFIYHYFRLYLESYWGFSILLHGRNQIIIHMIIILGYIVIPLKKFRNCTILKYLYILK